MTIRVASHAERAWQREGGALQREQLQAGGVGQRGQQRAPARKP